MQPLQSCASQGADDEACVRIPTSGGIKIVGKDADPVLVTDCFGSVEDSISTKLRTFKCDGTTQTPEVA